MALKQKTVLCNCCDKLIGSNNFSRHVIICEKKRDLFPYPCLFPNKTTIGSCVKVNSEIHKFHIPRKHDSISRSKISKSRIEYLTKNPDRVPYLLNHSSKESYPERYFNTILTKYQIEFVREYQVGLYGLDFALIKNKIALEIDGEQHYVDNKIIESDIKRTKKLEDLGWNIIRVRWSRYKKLSLNERTEFIKDLISKLR